MLVYMMRSFCFCHFRRWKCQLRRVRGNREQHRCERNRSYRSGSGRAGAEGCVSGTFAFYLFPFVPWNLHSTLFQRDCQHGKHGTDTISLNDQPVSFNYLTIA